MPCSTRSARIRRGAAADAAHGRVFAALQHRAAIHAHGEDLSGGYFLAVAMNIRRIGTVLELAPDADADDGRSGSGGERPDGAVASIPQSAMRVHTVDKTTLR